MYKRFFRPVFDARNKIFYINKLISVSVKITKLLYAVHFIFFTFNLKVAQSLYVQKYITSFGTNFINNKSHRELYFYVYDFLLKVLRVFLFLKH